MSRLRALFQRARAERRTTIQQWNKNHRVMHNRTWTGNLAEWIPTPEVPEVRQVVGRCVAWVTDSRPAFDLAPAAQPFSPFWDHFDQLSWDMKTALDAAWVTYAWELEIEKATWDAYTYGVGLMKVGWDPSLAYGLGDAYFRRVDPYTFYPDPKSTSMNDANYFCEASTISLQELDRRFPGAVERFELQAYMEDVDEMPDFRRASGQAPMANPGAISPATTARYGLPGQSRERVATTDAGVTLLEFWLREHTPFKVGNETRVFENWRCICIAGPHVLLNKTATQILPFNTHPYERFTPEDMGEFYPQSMVELLTPAQRGINRLLGSYILGIEYAGNPILKEGQRSGTQRQRMAAKPGSRHTVAEGSTFEFMQPPTLQQGIMEGVNFFINRMEVISGLQAIQQGASPGGRIAADVLDSMMEAGFVRIRLAQRGLEYMLRGAGQKLTAIMSEFYTTPRLVSIVGADGQRTSMEMRARHFYVPDKDGKAPLRFQILVRAGSMAPTSRQGRINEADGLFAMGGIDREALLEAHDTPNRRLILERIADAEAKGTFMPPGARQRARRV